LRFESGFFFSRTFSLLSGPSMNKLCVLSCAMHNFITVKPTPHGNLRLFGQLEITTSYKPGAENIWLINDLPSSQT
jgi:hypothetical protein